MRQAAAVERQETGGEADQQRPVLRIASLSGSRDVIHAAAQHQAEEERARSHRFIRQADRERFILGRHLARDTIGSLFGIANKDCEFNTDANGKPRLRAWPGIDFNIAHSGDLVLVGVGAGMQIGVDVERHRDDVDLDGVSRLMFTACECNMILRGSQAERIGRFFRHWTLKEALVKALGTGLMREPRRFAIDASASPFKLNFMGAGPDDIGTGWIIRDVAAPSGYSAGVAWRCLDGTRPVAPSQNQNMVNALLSDQRLFV